MGGGPPTSRPAAPASSARSDIANFQHTETLVVVEGELVLAADGAEPLVVGANAGAVVARTERQ